MDRGWCQMGGPQPGRHVGEDGQPSAGGHPRGGCNDSETGPANLDGRMLQFRQRQLAMISNITLENFKCFRHISVDPKLITVFIGPNGTGKSGVIQALLLLKQSRDDVRQLTLIDDSIRFASEAFMLHRNESISDNVRISLCGYSTIESEEVVGSIKFDVNLQYSERAGLEGVRGSTMWECSDGQYLICFDKLTGRSSAKTPRGSFSFDILPQINSFGNIGATAAVHQSLPLFKQVSQAPTKMLADLKTVPAVRGLTRENLQIRAEIFRRHFWFQRPRSTGVQHCNDPSLFPTRDGRGFASHEADYGRWR